MKYIKRILMLPFAVVVWVFYFTIDWVRYGGQLTVNKGKPVISPEEFHRLLTEISEKLSDNLNNLKKEQDDKRRNTSTD